MPSVNIIDQQDDTSSNAAERLWRIACGTLMTPATSESWRIIAESSPPDTIWHCVKNCVAYQSGVWLGLCGAGTRAMQPAGFQMALVLRHTPKNITMELLAELLRMHPQAQDLTSYIVALLTDDVGGCSTCTSDGKKEPKKEKKEFKEEDVKTESYKDGKDMKEEGAVKKEETASSSSNSGESSPSPTIFPSPFPASPESPAPLRDLQLFGDCEIAVLAARQEIYDQHAKLVRKEYKSMADDAYRELRIRVLNQLLQIPKLFHTPEFAEFEAAARDNISREITNLRAELLTRAK